MVSTYTFRVGGDSFLLNAEQVASRHTTFLQLGSTNCIPVDDLNTLQSLPQCLQNNIPLSNSHWCEAVEYSNDPVVPVQRHLGGRL